MPMRLMRELGRLLLKLWAEQAFCAAGRDLDRNAAPHARGLASGRGDALAG
jgi:hypothetical protein